MQSEQISTARAAFEADGFYLYQQPLIPADVIQGAIDGMDAMCRGEYETGIPPQPSFWNPGDPPNKLVKIEMSQISDRRIHQLVSHPALGTLAAEITGAEWVQVWWVQLLIKPPVDSQNVKATIGWHQDFHYWRHSWEDDSQLFTAWVALTDVTEAAGPMKFVRGSQNWGLLEDSDFFGDFEKQELRAPDQSAWEQVSAVLPPGGVSFHDKLVFHGSGANISGQPRRSFAIHLRTNQSRPRNREGLTEFIDNLDYCPVIYGKM